jgi:membrane fusion protein, copper/silver efflux system
MKEPIMSKSDADSTRKRLSQVALRLAGGLFPAILILVLLPAAFLFGYALRGPGPEADSGAMETPERAVDFWTCSMHPQVQQPGPGKCPICHMDLIPVSADDSGGVAGAAVFSTSEAARELMRIQTAPVERRFVSHEIRMVGKIDFDETNLAYITAWVPGRLDRLYVDFTGIEVRKGDHMVYLYSPDLLAAQEDLRRAAKALAGIRQEAPEVLKDTAKAAVTASREKLRRWGLTDAQIDGAEKQGGASDHVTIYAPVAGTVVNRSGQEGMYVDTGTRIYTIADLTSLWVKLDAYESDLTWLRYGQKVTFEAEALPGEKFEGQITFIDPVLDKATRTAKVRVIVKNKDRRLKPEMFVRATVRAQVAGGGRVMDPALAGKWISPMHPEVIKDGPGTCDVCGMALVKAEDLGYMSAESSETEPPLVIPASAPLITGARAVVYVEAPDGERPTYEGREVVLGPRAGDFYIVREGLAEGERVVTNGNFKIDSALQILAKPSMMAPEGGAPTGAHDHGSMSKTATPAVETPDAFKGQLGSFYEAYLVIGAALASDDFETASRAVPKGKGALETVDMKLLDGAAHTVWMDHLGRLGKALTAMEAAGDIEAARQAFEPLSMALLEAIQAFGMASDKPAFRTHCPMAFEWKGADWLQADEDIRNPYFGASMLTCGEVKGQVGSGSSPTDHADGSDHKDVSDE